MTKPFNTMERPKIATVTVQWIDKYSHEHIRTFSETTLEEAETLLGLMTGNITENDLLP